jgi:hypothetical protein
MPNQSPPPFPDDDTLDSCLSSDNDLSMVVRAHQCIEIALEHLIKESLPVPHVQITARLPFTFKVDLAIGLSALHSDLRVGLLAINKIRNKFAHDLRATITEEDRADLYNGLPQHMREFLGEQDTYEPLIYFRDAAGFIFLQLKWTLQAIKDNKIYTQALHEVLQDKLAQAPPGSRDPFKAGVDARVKAKMDKIKASLKEQST